MFNFVASADILVCNDASIRDLESKLERVHGEHWRDNIDLSHATFRPNVVVDGQYPYAEERFRRIQFNKEMQARFVGTCCRCVQTAANY